MERPSLHFTPRRNWMNDPNGLVRVGDAYHLFYQHNPDAVDHANLHWGHASSPDLFTWTHLPVALSPDELGEIYSGTVVIDDRNTAGFGAGAMVAIFTHATPGTQSQSLAYSVDDGLTWEKYAANPVLDPPPGFANFRDPKVLWFEIDGERGRWVMGVAAGDEVRFYNSDDLKRWHEVSVFTPERPWPGATFEVPELLRVPVTGEDREEWVLILSAHERRGDATVCSQVVWAPGRFDGCSFAVDPQTGSMQRLDHGPHFYAPLAWTNGPRGRPVLLGWMDEWGRYLAIPDQPWCGRMSLPRELALDSTPEGYTLVQRPLFPAGLLANGDRSDIAPGETRALEPPGSFRLAITAPRAASRYRVVLVPAAQPQETFELTSEGSVLTLHLTGSPGSGPVRVATGGADMLELEVVVDAGSIEVFIDGGAQVASFINRFRAGALGAEITNGAKDPIRVEISQLGAS
jgi:sucrose-6-phosphate hydrolase SacC (GH32 family)